MADNDPDCLKGSSCTATLDWAARTLTFEHRGWFRSKPQKASPVIVPFNEIAGVESEWGTITGWFRISRHGHEPWKGGVASDPHGLNCAVDPTEFAMRVQQAVGIDPSEPVAAEPVEAPVQSAPADDDAANVEPKPDGKVVKAVDGVLDFFSKWN
jgi:hypothetical protein